MSRNKSINFIKASQRSTSDKLMEALIVFVLIAVPLSILGAFGYVAYNNMKQVFAINSEIEGYKNYAADPDVVNKLAILDELDQKNSKVQSYMGNREYAIFMQQSSNYMDPAKVDALVDSLTPGCILSGLTYSDGTIDYEIYATDFNDGANYMDRIQATGLYSSLTYVGFESLSASNPDPEAVATNYYHYHVTVNLISEAEERSVEQ